MAMETRLSLRQSQRVVMTPLLQQAIQLLQLSTLELQEVVQKELLENPLLEEMQPETAEQPDGKDAPPDVPTAPPAEPLSSDAAPAPTTERQTDDLPFDLTAVIFDDHEERSLVAQEDREDLPFENMVRSVSSLTDHLDEQLRYASDDPLVRRIGTEIIGNLDEDGYLRASDEEIAQRCQTAVEEVRKVVALVQAFDPPGVAARSIQECLLIQLKADPNPDPVSVEIVEEHFEDLSRRRYPDIARALKLPLDRIMESVEEIMGLEPKPGRRFGGNDSRYIVPDVVVHKMGSEYVVVLNEDGIPRLRVNSLYRSLLRNSADGEARQYVDQKLRSALWLNWQGQRIGPQPLVSGFDTRRLVTAICGEQRQYSWQLMNWKIATKELAVSGSDYMTAFRNKSKLTLLKHLLFGNKELAQTALTAARGIFERTTANSPTIRRPGHILA